MAWISLPGVDRRGHDSSDPARHAYHQPPGPAVSCRHPISDSSYDHAFLFARLFYLAALASLLIVGVGLVAMYHSPYHDILIRLGRGLQIIRPASLQSLRLCCARVFPFGFIFRGSDSISKITQKLLTAAEERQDETKFYSGETSMDRAQPRWCKIEGMGSEVCMIQPLPGRKQSPTTC
eukprot:766286-Hanusia_phi.AAC.5